MRSISATALAIGSLKLWGQKLWGQKLWGQNQASGNANNPEVRPSNPLKDLLRFNKLICHTLRDRVYISI